MSDNKVLVVMGSDSDFPVMEGCFKMLNKFGVEFKATVASAHRTPDKAMALARGALSPLQVSQHIWVAFWLPIQHFLLSVYLVRAALSRVLTLFMLQSRCLQAFR